MSKAVLISIRPEWCKKIASGRKTIELRKTKPKLELPFKCYIYCTQNTPYNPSIPMMYENESGNIYIGGKHYKEFLTGKVIGEFVCDGFLCHCEMGNADLAEQMGCVRREDIRKYAGEKEVFGWHISDLKIYDKPKSMAEFTKPYGTIVRAFDSPYIQRPPQSWCYVEDVE